jgi:hypothetical protein
MAFSGYSTNKTDHNDIAEILLKLALYPITPNPPYLSVSVLLVEETGVQIENH